MKHDELLGKHVILKHAHGYTMQGRLIGLTTEPSYIFEGDEGHRSVYGQSVISEVVCRDCVGCGATEGCAECGQYRESGPLLSTESRMPEPSVFRAALAMAQKGYHPPDTIRGYAQRAEDESAHLARVAAELRVLADRDTEIGH